MHEAPADVAPGTLEPLLGERLARLVAESVAQAAALAAADAASLERLRGALGVEAVVVPDLGREVYDIEGLRSVALALGYEPSPRSETSPSAAQ